ncbi:MAG TPA: ABC transporter substrate-binding protein [Candidatus Cloacimonadota bacterium]|nr:ABC transporter substrate-binding protein [Candidatus Cloacimonadota bacterium]HPS37923.1 ABC transporter substrate-binding protein [Candidatus Cloacimonadota bacterium]
MKKALILCITLFLILGISSCKKEKDSAKPKEITKVRVTLDWTPNTNHTGLYVAKELGFFKDAGLDVEIIQPGQNTSDQIVANGSSEFGISYQENVITARAKSIPLVSIGAVIQHNTSAFASLKAANILTPKDFEGKRYGSWDSPSEKAILKSIMLKAGANYTNVQIISGVADFFSTIGKDADFEWIYLGWTGIEAKQRGIELNLINLKDLDPVFDYYTPVVITSEKMIQSKPEIVRAFMKAVSQGYDYCISHPGQAAGILVKHAPELNPDLVRMSMDYLAKEYKAEAPRWGEQKDTVWKNFSDWMYSNHLIDTNIDAKAAWTNDFLPQ